MMDASHGSPLIGLLALTLVLVGWLWKSHLNHSRLEQRLGALIERERLLNCMIASLPDPTFAIDQQNRVIIWNHALEKLTGVPAAAMLGRSENAYALPLHGERRPMMIDLVNQWDDAVARRYSNLERLGDVLVAEIITQNAPLGERHLRLVAGPLHDEAGRTIGAIECLQDITHRRMALKALEGREELLRVLVAHTPLAVAMCDRQMNYLYHSRRWITDFGLPDTDYIGRGHYDVFGPIPAHWKAQHARCLAGETIESEAEPFTRLDGRVEWLRRILYPWRTAEGEVGGIIFLLELITAEKRAEQAAQEMDRRLQTIGDNLPGGVLFQQRISADGARQFTYVSRNANKRYGFGPEAVMADPDLFFRHFSEEGRQHLLRAEAKAIQDVSVLDETLKVQRKSGKLGWERIVAQPKRLMDGTTLFDGIALDITATKLAEADLRLMEHVLQNSPAVLIRWLPGEGWPVDYVSGNVSQFGYTSQELISGAVNYGLLVHPDDRSRVIEEVHQHTTAGTTHFQQEYRILTKSGKMRWLDDRTVVERDRDGSVSHFMGVLLDITDRKAAQQEIVRRQLYLESVLHHAPDAIITLNDQSRVVDWNPGAQALFGYTADEAIGQLLVDLVAKENDDALPAVEQNLKIALSGKRVEAFEAVRCRKDGQAVHVIVAGSPIIMDGMLNGVVAMYTDITALKKAENDLRRNEHMLRRIIDLVPSTIFVKNAEGRYLMVNQAMADCYGMTVEDLVGRFQAEVHPDPAQVQRYLADDRRAMETGRTIFIAQVPFLLPTGESRWNEVVKVPCDIDDFGEPAIVGLATDITERRQVEAALRMAQFSFDKAAIGIYWVGSDARILNVNDYAAAILGYPKEALTGMSIWDINPQISRENWATVWQQAKDSKLDLFETIHLSKDGSQQPVEIYASALEYDGQQYIIAFVKDIAERKIALEELHRLRNYLSNIINSMPSVLVGVDQEGRVTQWNAQAERITGLSFENARFQPLASVFPQLAGERDRIQRAIQDRQVIRDSKIPRRQQSEIRYEDVTIFPLVANGVEGAVIRVDDVTEQVRMEEMMIQSEKMLSVGGLAAGMAHEINNPLAGILQNSAVLESRLTDDLPANLKAAEAAGTTMTAIRKYLELRRLTGMLANIRSSGNRAAEIVKNMLSFARKSDHVISRHDLGELLDQTLDLARTDYDMKKRYDFKQIQIHRKYDPAVGPVPCEASKLQQVFLNILKNGAEAMAAAADERHPPAFTLSVIDNDPWLRVEIADNGPGMDETTRRRIFEPFFTTKPVGEGTGLGLSVSYFIITENHGGTMDVVTAPGKGSCFVINLPKTGKPS